MASLEIEKIKKTVLTTSTHTEGDASSHEDRIKTLHHDYCLWHFVAFAPQLLLLYLGYRDSKGG